MIQFNLIRNYFIFQGHANVVEVLIKSGSDINEWEMSVVRKENALRKAAEIGNSQIFHIAYTSYYFKLLLCKMFRNSFLGNKQIVKLLVGNGAVVHLENRDGQTARDIAKNLGKIFTSELLLF